MGNDLKYYRNNILLEIEKNKEIEKMLIFIRTNYKKQNKMTLKIDDFFSPKISVEKSLIIDLLEKMQLKNEEYIDKYLELSFNNKTYPKKEENNEL